MKVSGRFELAVRPAPPSSRSADTRQVAPAASAIGLPLTLQKSKIGTMSLFETSSTSTVIFWAPTFRITHAAFVPTLFPLVLIRYGGGRGGAGRSQERRAHGADDEGFHIDLQSMSSSMTAVWGKARRRADRSGPIDEPAATPQAEAEKVHEDAVAHPGQAGALIRERAHLA